jgi:hypothetical protein
MNLVFLGVESWTLRRLASRYRNVIAQSGSDLVRPLVSTDLKDPPGQVSYIQKFVTYQRPAQQIGNTRSEPVPLNPPQHNELLPWMGRYEPSDFLFLQNIPSSAFRSVTWNVDP